MRTPRRRREAIGTCVIAAVLLAAPVGSALAQEGISEEVVLAMFTARTDGKGFGFLGLVPGVSTDADNPLVFKEAKDTGKYVWDAKTSLCRKLQLESVEMSYEAIAGRKARRITGIYVLWTRPLVRMQVARRYLRLAKVGERVAAKGEYEGMFVEFHSEAGVVLGDDGGKLKGILLKAIEKEDIPKPPAAPPGPATDKNAQLRQAAARGQVRHVAALLKAGADVNAADSDGYTALHLAAIDGNAGMIKFLVAAGARITAVNAEGRNPMHMARDAKTRELLATLLRDGGELVHVQTLGGMARSYAEALRKGDLPGLKKHMAPALAATLPKTVPAIDFTIGRTLVRYRGKMAIFTIDLTFAKPTGLGKEWALTVSLRPDAKGLNWKIVDTALEPVVGEK